MSQKHTITFKFEKETPGTIKWKEITEPGTPPKVDSLYVKKWVFGEVKPDAKLTVTIELP